MRWQEQALCRPGHLDLVEFDPRWLDEHASDAEHALAAEVCDVCPVMADCSTAAEDGREVGMVWGGRMRGTHRPCRLCGEPTSGPSATYCTNCRESVLTPVTVLPRPDDVPPGHCVECVGPLTGKQVRYCSVRCSTAARNRRERDRKHAAKAEREAVA